MKLIRPISLLFVLLAMAVSPAFAQDIIVKVKLGGATLGNVTLKESSASATMKSGDVLGILPGALVIARQDVIIVEIPGTQEDYTYKDVLALIQKKKQASSGSFATVAFKDPIQKTNPTPLKGSSTRGKLDETAIPDFYYPYDNMLVYDSKVQFIVGGKGSTILSNVVVKNLKTNEVFHDAMPDGNTFELADLPEGDYEWTYSIDYYDAAEKVVTDFKNTFKVPSDKEKKALAKKVETFKKDLKGFSPNMQEVLLIEYCAENNLYRYLPEELKQ